jgi:ABC-type uncharacterized transport system permease subunit
MNRLTNDLNFLINLQKMSWKSFLVYRVQALTWIFANLLVILNSIIAITVIYTVSSGIPGWSYFQVLALSSITTMMFGIVDYMVAPWNIARRLRVGSMDTWFTKPYSYFMILSGGFGMVWNSASFISGLALFTYSVMQLNITFIQFLYFALLFAAGTTAFLMFFIMMSIVSYHLMKSGHFIDNMESMLSNAGVYPLSVYGVLGQIIFTLAMPVGIAYYYPAEALLGMIGPVAVVAALLLAAVITFVSRKVFYRLLRDYSSGGG